MIVQSDRRKLEQKRCYLFPDINDFVTGLKKSLKPNGTITMEFPHLMNLIKYNQFDTVYHEHFSYFSLKTVIEIFKFHGLAIVDVDELPTHGGSLRIYAVHNEQNFCMHQSVADILKKEEYFNLHNLKGYAGFQSKVNEIKYTFLQFLLTAKKDNKNVVCYGAAAKGNTLLNYCGIKNDLIEFIVDRAASKQGKFMPGSHIPIFPEDKIKDYRPDYIVILPWNIKEEIAQQLAYIKSWNGKLVTVIPHLEIF